MTEEEIEACFERALAAYREMPREISAALAIKSITKHRVIPLATSDSQDKELLELLTSAARNCMVRLADDPILCTRINEAGNLFEPRLMTACKEVGLKATAPPGGTSGYPDLLIYDRHDRPTYIEVKTVGPGKETSPFRSFYLSPSESPKVRQDARHILVAFLHETSRHGSGQIACRASAFKLVDLSKVVGSVKFEYQSSNKKMYAGVAVVSSGIL